MRSKHKWLLLPVLVGLVLVGLLGITAISAGGPPEGKPQVISVLGIAKVNGQDAIVDVIVVVPAGQNANEAARRALEGQGARPFDSAALGSEGFTLTGFVWPSTEVQNYNDGSGDTSAEPEPSGIEGLAAVSSSLATWNGVTTSFFETNFGTLTDRCPSLVRGCKGPQVFDTHNDVAWLQLQPGVLGVAWFASSSLTGLEIDIALSTRFDWNDGCRDVLDANGNLVSFDAQTVFAHENGHFVGLSHTDDKDALMYPFIGGAHCSLGTDDEEGATYLYPTQKAIVNGTVTDVLGNVISGATVVLEDTPFSTETAGDGNYEFSENLVGVIPYPVTYDITASHPDGSLTIRVRVVQDPETVDFDFAAPDAVDDTAEVDEGASVAVLVLANDSDPNGDSLAITSVSTPSNGTATINDNGTVGDTTDDFIDYAHDGSETTSNSFSYTISDGSLTDTATVTITVNPVNDEPEPTATPTPTPGAGGSVHVGDLDGQVKGNNNWQAVVTVTVHDGDDALVENATVSGDWTASGNGSRAECTTNASGTCDVKSGKLNGVLETTFSVDNVTHATLTTYDSGVNHDPDIPADSDGTKIIVSK
jgi:hypothetical protein